MCHSSLFPQPRKNAIIFEDDELYACLASFPLVKGHCIVVWKKNVTDLHLLSRKEYEHLMDAVDDLRTALLKTLKIKKVYLMYLDEAQHVHWHLIPRHAQKGYTILLHTPSKLWSCTLVTKIRKNLSSLLAIYTRGQ